MKKLSIAFILLITVSLSSFAGSPANNYPRFKGIEHFMRMFPQATEVDCKNKGEFTEVNFIWNGLKLAAYYDREGSPIATCREVSSGNLPLAAQLKLKDEYSGYIIRLAMEYDDVNDGLSYYVTVINGPTAYLLHISTDGNISVFKKMRN
jgi:hypothetical protein